MKLLILIGFCAVLAVCSAVNSEAASGFRLFEGHKHEFTSEMKWIMMPDDSGKPQIAILNGPKSTRPLALVDDVKFYLYTRANPVVGYQLFVGDIANLNNSPFTGGQQTMFLVHGYTSDLSSAIIQDLKTAYLDVGSYNVIGVDWSVLAAGPLYNVAADNVLPTGGYVGQMVDHLVNNGGATYGRMHLTGHSLGGHVCGDAGAATGGRVARITGLDAALPLFDSRPNSERLNPTDAVFVDSIHTCGGGLGFLDPVAHADFYPNGGQAPQPDCGTDVSGNCSHGKAYEYFENTIRNNGIYPAHQCSTLNDALAGTCAIGTSGNMGEGATSAMSGFYWMAT